MTVLDLLFNCGKGAGRWPATESVVADVFDLCRANSNGRRVHDLHQTFNTSAQNEENAHAPLGD